MDECLSSIEQYLQGVFALVESIDDHAGSMADDRARATSVEFDGDRADHTPSDDDHDRPSFDTDVGGLRKDSEVESIGNLTDAQSIVILSKKLGAMVGDFLVASDLEDIIDQRNTRRQKPLAARMASGVTGSDDPYRPAHSQSKSPGQINHHVTRPCWYHMVSGGLALKLTVHDDQGGRLSLKSEEELLRAQRSKCIGCGEPLVSSLFGLDRNFQPCRYHGGLVS